LLGHISEEAQGILQDRQHATQTIKEKLIKAQERIKKYDYKSKERELQGDMLHLKIQHYRLSVSKDHSNYIPNSMAHLEC
jgi:hypothetical protein